MTDDPIRIFSNTCDEYDKATEKINNLSSIILKVGTQLQRKPYGFSVSNCGVGFPAEVTFSSSVYSLNANEWPTAKTIAEALSDLHKKRKGVENAWYKLSDADKKVVKAPNFLKER
jgi:hypothetical protein